MTAIDPSHISLARGPPRPGRARPAVQPDGHPAHRRPAGPLPGPRPAARRLARALGDRRRRLRRAGPAVAPRARRRLPQPLLRMLEAEGLVTVGANERDRRVRTARLTTHGRRERRLLDRRSDDLAAALLAPLSDAQRTALVDAMGRVDRLLTASLVTIDVVDPATPDAQACLAAYFAELDERFDTGFDPDRSLTAGVDEMRLPHGLFVVARLHGEPVGCGGVKLYDDRPAYIKRMWVHRGARGLSLGRRLLAELEALAAGERCRRGPTRDEPDARRGDRHVPLGGVPRGRPVQRRGLRRSLVRETARLSFTPRKQSVPGTIRTLWRRRRAGSSTETPNGRWTGSAVRRRSPARLVASEGTGRHVVRRRVAGHRAGGRHGTAPDPRPSRRRRGRPGPTRAPDGRVRPGTAGTGARWPCRGAMP